MSEPTVLHCRRPLRIGIHLVAGAVGVLAGLQYFFSPKSRRKATGNCGVRSVAAVDNTAQPANTRRDYFSIRRTKSDLGYVYWVLKGYGEFQCFILFDTWREAVDEASRRIDQAGALDELQPLRSAAVAS